MQKRTGTTLSGGLGRSVACCVALASAGAVLALDARTVSIGRGASSDAVAVQRTDRLARARPLANQLPGAPSQRATSPLWDDVAEENLQAAPPPSRRFASRRYRTLRLNDSDLAIALDAAPLEPPTLVVRMQNSTAEIDVPWPDGGFKRFAIEETSVMAPALARRFPGLRTFRGRGVDDPSLVARLDWTPAGFHAMVISAEGIVFVDPYSPDDRRHYVAYHKADYRRAGGRPFREEPLPRRVEPDLLMSLQPQHGDTLRTYRLAVAATGEYAMSHGGTVAGAMNGIVTTINRVNGIYERDLAVRMVLVPNNASLVFTNAATDGYSNNSGSAMLCENARTIDAVIGQANYDIGHVFSTGGGGLAALGVVCSNTNACGAQPGSQKARGVTGSLSPQGDPFDVDFVAHEIGHQFGANHTFNGTTQRCQVPRNAGTAYEPASGSTVMAYAGICGAENLQSNSDAYFHAASQDEIIAFITNASCAATVSTGNIAPTVDAGSDYTIPSGTPFALTAQGADSDGDVLTYVWEEMDLGTASPPHTDDGTRPLFRSFRPIAASTRTFPQLSDLLTNTTTLGETLPTTARAMTFRVTVRDNALGGGGTAADDMVLTVSTASGPFVVTAPNTAVTWNTGSTQTVTWDVANTTAGPVNAANVKVSLSIDGGNTFPVVLAASTPNDGSQAVVVPHFSTTSGRIKVEAIGNVFFDISNQDFTISAFTPSVSIGDVSVLEAASGSAVAVFTVSLSGPSASTVTVDYATANATATTPGDYTAGSGTVTIAPGRATATIAVGVNGDESAEADETFEVNLSNPVNATTTDTQGIGTIVNDDGTVVSPGIADGTFEVGWPWSGWTTQTSTNYGSPLCDVATCGASFGPYSGSNWAYFGGVNAAEGATLGQTVTFPLATSLVLQFQMRVATVAFNQPEGLVVSVDGNTVQTFVNPSSAESVYSLRQVDVSAYADGQPHALLFSYLNVPLISEYATFLVDDVQLMTTAPTLSIDDVGVTEGNSATGVATFTVRLWPARASTVTVNYATADDTAAAGSDYVSTSNVVTFTSGQTTQTINVTVNGDTTFEPNERFLLNLTSASGATITDGQGVGLITNDEETSTSSALLDGTFEAGSPNSAWTVQSSSHFGTPICSTGLCGTGGGTAGPNAGSNWAWFGGANAPEVATIGQTLTLPQANSLTLQFGLRIGQVAVPHTDTLTVSVDGTPVQSLTEPFAAEGSYSVRQLDLTPFADGNSHALLLTYNGPTSGIGSFSVDDIALIVSPATAPTLSIHDVVVAEGDSSTRVASFTVTLSTTSAQTVTASYATADGTAAAGSDYALASGTVTFPAGVAQRRIDVIVSGDTQHEANETFLVNLSSPTNATLSDSQGQGTIYNDDAMPSLSVNDATVTEGSAGVTSATFTVTLSAASGQTVTVGYTTAGGTAAGDGTDYATASSTLSFAPGSTTEQIVADVVGDTLDEATEVFFVNLGSPINASISGRPGVGTITDDDPTPSLTIGDVTVTEGNGGVSTATFTVALSAASGQQITVGYATANGTATVANGDYTATSGFLTFAPGVTTQPVAVTVAGDGAVEPTEDFQVNLAGAVNATIADPQGVGTITNDD